MFKPNLPVEQALPLIAPGQMPMMYTDIPKALRVPEIYDLSKIPTNLTDVAEIYETIRQNPYVSFYLEGKANSGKTTAAVRAGRRDLSIGNGIFLSYHDIPPFESFLEEHRKWWDDIHTLLEKEGVDKWSAADFFATPRKDGDGLDVFFKKVIITDVDPLPAKWAVERRRGLGKIVEWCYNYDRPIIITSTHPIETMQANDQIDPHVVERLLESCVVLQTPEKSYIKDPFGVAQ